MKILKRFFGKEKQPQALANYDSLDNKKRKPNVPLIGKFLIAFKNFYDILKFVRNQTLRIIYEENKNCSPSVKYYCVYFSNDNGLKHRRLCTGQWLKQALGVGVYYAA